MSEYQYVAFRAIDGPVSEKQLCFMQLQSTRAEITPWTFTNEYHYGDFRGDTLEMMRRGYDIHLHYAIFGVRRLMIRLPQGFENDKAAAPYLLRDRLCFIKDKKGSGGTLCVEPFYESGDLDELWGIDDLLERLEPIRSEIMDGDLRPLYLAHLAVSVDSDHDREQTIEAPVPAGLSDLTDAQLALAELYEIDESSLAAVAQGSPRITTKEDPLSRIAEWLSGQTATTKDAWLAELLVNPDSSDRSEILAKFRSDRTTSTWPTVNLKRTVADIYKAALDIQRKLDSKALAAAAASHKKKMAKMRTDPGHYLRETEQLVRLRGIEAYRQISELLSELREALADSERADLAEKQARKLKKKHPTLHHLTAALRSKGFVPK